MIKVSEDSLPGTCGVSILYGFTEDKDDSWKLPIDKLVPSAGCGIVCAGFVVGNTISDDAFYDMCQRGKLLFMTKPRKNRNSGNMFYFAVFDYKKNNKTKYGFNDADNAYYGDDVNDEENDDDV